MNICILKESLKIGGTERSAANISKVLYNEHNVCLALFDASQTKCTYKGTVVDFKLPPRSSVFGKIVNTFRRDLKLRRLLKQNHIDILYTFTSIVNRQTYYRYNTIKIISARDFGAMAKRHRDYNSALKNSSAMICNSKYIAQYYLEKYPEHKDRVFTVYNYINTEEIQQQSKEETPQEFNSFITEHNKTVVSVGRFCKEKGFEYLIEAIAKAREKENDLGLVLVGGGDFEQKYLEAIKKFGLEGHVYFAGFQKNPYNYMAKCSCFVLSSLSEGFPNVLLEAMALGLPVIATNCYSGPAEILRDDADYSAIGDRYVECDYGIIAPAMKDADNQAEILELSKAITNLITNQTLCNKYYELSLKRSLDFSEDVARQKLNELFNILQGK